MIESFISTYDMMVADGSIIGLVMVIGIVAVMAIIGRGTSSTTQNTQK